MAAPKFVPTDPTKVVRAYSSPHHAPSSWVANRAGEIGNRQPSGIRLGTTGPDQGYVYKLLGVFDDQLHLGGVSRADADAGCCAIAMRRSALFGRGPVIHDLTIAYTLWGFLDEEPDAELVGLREEMFSQIKSNHHYVERREVVDAVTEDALRQQASVAATSYRVDWRRNLDRS